jgi:hypothetical protein
MTLQQCFDPQFLHSTLSLSFHVTCFHPACANMVFRNVFMIISLVELDQEGDNVQADDMQYLGRLPGLDSLSSQTGPS